MACNEIVQDINEVARQYFENPTNDLKQQLIKMLYKDASIKSILLKAFSCYSEIITADDLGDIKHNVLFALCSRIFEEKLYSPEKGLFMNYVRASVYNDCKSEIGRIVKRNRKMVANVCKSGDDEKDLLDQEDKSLDGEKRYSTPEESVIENEDIEKIRREVFRTINFFYKLTKAGRKNKGLVSVFLTHEILLECTEDEFEALVQKYDFLRDNADLLRDLRKGKEVLSAVEFSLKTGIAESKISTMQTELKRFLQEKLSHP